MAADQTTVAKRRQTEPPRLIHQVRGDLDWIVMKCLEKDRTRRYETANGLAQDVERHLNNEPVRPGRPAQCIGFRSFGQRHRAALAVASGFALILLAGTVVSTWQAIRANRNAREQVRQRHLAETARGQVTEALNQMAFQRAEALLTAGDSATAVAGLARLLRDNPTNDAAAERLLSALTYRRFALPVTDWIRHEGMAGAQFSPAGQYFAASCSDKSAGVWDAETGQLVASIRRRCDRVFHRIHPGWAWAACGARKALISRVSTTWLLAACCGNSGTRENSYPGHGSAVTDSASSPSAKAVRRCLEHGRGKSHSHQCLSRRAAGIPRHGSVHSDGRLVLTTGGNETARLWAADTGAVLADLLGHSGPVTSGDFHPDGHQVATVSRDNTLRIWETQAGALNRVLHGPAGVRSLSYSPDGRWIVAWGGNAATVWNAETGELLHTIPHKAEVVCAGFSPDGQRLATGAFDGTARIWEVKTGEPLIEVLRHGAYVNSIQFSTDGLKLVTTSADNVARVWDTEPAHVLCIALWNRLRQPVPWANYFTSFSPDANRVVAGGGPEALVWDALTGRRLPVPPLRHGSMVMSAEFSKDGQRIATASADYTARIWDAHSGKDLVQPIVHSNQVLSAQFSPDGRRLLTSSPITNGVRLWEARTGRWVRDFQRDAKNSYSSAQSARTAAGW